MSTILDMGIPDVGSGILHPKHKNRFRATFANLGGGTDSTPVSMQVTNFKKPKLTFEKITLHRYNSVSHVGGKHSFDPVSITIQDDVLGTAAAVLQAQLQKQQWLIGAEGQWLAAAGEGSLYKFVTYLDALDGGTTVTEKWTLEGCWIEDIDWGELDYSTGEPVQITVTLSIDHARQNLGGYEGPGIATGGAGRIAG